MKSATWRARALELRRTLTGRATVAALELEGINISRACVDNIVREAGGLERIREPSRVALAKLEPVRIDDWVVFAGGEGQVWIRDLDLAKRAEMKNPHDIRVHIKAAISEGLIGIAAGDANLSPRFGSAAADNATLSAGVADKALVRRGDEIITSGKGRTQEVTAYYLNEETALLLLTRLRTPKAITLTKAIVRVFLAVTRGRVASQRSRAADDGAVLRELQALRGEMAELRAEVRERPVGRRSRGAHRTPSPEAGPARGPNPKALRAPTQRELVRGGLVRAGFRASAVEQAINKLGRVEELGLEAATREVLALLG